MMPSAKLTLVRDNTGKPKTEISELLREEVTRALRAEPEHFPPRSSVRKNIHEYDPVERELDYLGRV